jgi:RimJ/RimL family protein N-acetyltransferase
MEWAQPDPRLHAGRIALRQFRRDDARAVVAACADRDIMRFTFMKDGLTEPEAVAWIERSNEWWPLGHPRFAIVDGVDDHLLGQIGVAVNEHHRSAEAHYWVTAEERGRGVASLALGLVADWAFSNGVERLFLLIHPENEPSHRVAGRCGFTREGVLREYEPFKGTRPDLASWSLLPRDPRPWHGVSAPCP